MNGVSPQVSQPKPPENVRRISTRNIGIEKAITSLKAMIPRPLIGNSLICLKNHFP